ncbi:SDR family oxidoreductase [Alteribacillus sp. HJP-4]|uniref:SDR family oxidoreductase n=1 Tax=Alteribacillus sp. HJP-4 TaxID=2775394 RepID=UPI0035CCDDFB
MENKIVIITGANSGIGLHTAVGLLKKGAHVIFACRSKERGNQAMLIAKAASSSDKVSFLRCDLSSLRSINEFVSAFTTKFNTLDVLINNAGVVTTRRKVTEDNFEQMIGVNHLGHFYLTHQLLPFLKRSSNGKVIHVSSGAHKWGNIYFPDPHLHRGFGIWKAYCQSKLANILFSNRLAEQLLGTNVTSNALHPGAVSTNIGVSRENGFGKSIHKLLRPLFLTPQEGAETSIYLASQSTNLLNGAYIADKQSVTFEGAAGDPVLAEKLWTWSEIEIEKNGFRLHVN